MPFYSINSEISAFTMKTPTRKNALKILRWWAYLLSDANAEGQKTH